MTPEESAMEDPIIDLGSTVNALRALQDAIPNGSGENVRAVIIFIANNLEPIYDDLYEKYGDLLKVRDEEPEGEGPKEGPALVD